MPTTKTLLLKIPGVSSVLKPLRKAYRGFILSWAAHSVIDVTLNQSFSIDEQPYGSLFDLYTKEFLRKSLDKGVINNGGF